MSQPVDPAVLADMVHAAEQKLASAEHLLAGGFAGDASSRAYYAVFHMLSAVLASRGLSFSSHAQVLGAFNKEFLHTGAITDIAFRDIQQLWDDRQKGDYGAMLPVTPAAAERDVAIARNILRVCRDYLKRQGLLAD